MATDAEARQRMSEGLLARMDRDSDWRRDFVQAVAALFYELVHTNCPADCICVTNHLPGYDARGKAVGAPVPEGAPGDVG
jgi:hypothetical protein